MSGPELDEAVELDEEPSNDLLLKRFEKAMEYGRGNLDKYEEYAARYENNWDVDHLSLRAKDNIRPYQATVNWCRLSIDSLANRMTIVGFLTSLDEDLPVGKDGEAKDGNSVDALLWDWYQHANMDKETRLGNTEALLQGAIYIIVNWPEDSEYPEFLLATKQNMYLTYDHRTLKVSGAYQWYTDNELDDDKMEPDRGVIYTKNRILQVAKGTTGWYVLEEEAHDLGVVPVAPVINRAKVGDYQGRSELEDIVELSDFATRLMTNTQMAQEFLALPLRWAENASQEDFVNPDGSPTDAWQQFMSTFLAFEKEGASLHQLPGADLRNFTDVFNMLAKQVSSVSSLPPHALGLTTSNPASADAIRSGEANLVQRILDRCSAFEQGWEEAMRIALIWSDHPKSEAARDMRIETVWANPETPTFSAKADAVVKLRQAKVISNRQALEDLGYAPEKIEWNIRQLEQEIRAEYQADWDRADRALGEANGEPAGNDVPPSPDTSRQVTADLNSPQNR